MHALRALPALLMLLIGAAVHAAAPAFPALSGRVVDAANVLPPATVASLDAKSEGLQAKTGNQLVIATVPDLQGQAIEDYGYQLGRAWGIGEKGNNGVILLVAPNERKVRIEVGYGLEPVLTDAMTHLIIQRRIIPAFKAGDLPGGVEAGADAIIAQLGLPPEEAAANAARAVEQPRAARDRGPGLGGLVWFVVILFWIVAAASRRGRRSGLGGLGWFVLGQALGSSGRSGGSGWSGGGGGGGGWGGGGGFSGGGGSFGGGGSSGSW